MNIKIYDMILDQCSFDHLYEGDEYIIAIQTTESDVIGFDYTLFDRRTGKEIDGGIVENPEQDLHLVLRYLTSEYGQKSIYDFNEVILDEDTERLSVNFNHFVH